MVRSAANKKKILSKLMRVIKQRKKSQSLEKITKQNEVQNGSFKTVNVQGRPHLCCSDIARLSLRFKTECRKLFGEEHFSRIMTLFVVKIFHHVTLALNEEAFWAEQR